MIARIARHIASLFISPPYGGLHQTNHTFGGHLLLQATLIAIYDYTKTCPECNSPQ
jgi:hypothetical protein